MPLPDGAQPVTDCVKGALTHIDGAVLLSRQPLLPAGEELAYGALFLRYGIPYLRAPYVIIPGLVVADYGEMLSGEQAWDFLRISAHLHPRADLCGWRSDGSVDMLPLKHLDFDRPYAVFAFTADADTQPLAAVQAGIDPDPAWTPRLHKHLPFYCSLKAWRARD